MSSVVEPVVTRHSANFAVDVRTGLLRDGQKILPPKYLYDTLGSTLFEAITQLPEYGVWRAERRILMENAAEIAAYIDARTIIELGSGSANKTLLLLQPLLAKHAVTYNVVEISRAAIEMTGRQLAGIRGLNVQGIEDDYLSGLEWALQSRRDGKVLVLFLGGSLGNVDFTANVRFLSRLRRLLQPGDALLLGADLQKPMEQLLPAYDDALGVTAAFNRNYLVRMNRELCADCVLERFRHSARFNAELGDVEMHLVSLCDQRIRFADAGFGVSLRADETIHTESSHKYALDELAVLTSRCGFHAVMQWFDTAWPFMSGLYRVA